MKAGRRPRVDVAFVHNADGCRKTRAHSGRGSYHAMSSPQDRAVRFPDSTGKARARGRGPGDLPLGQASVVGSVSAPRCAAAAGGGEAPSVLVPCGSRAETPGRETPAACLGPGVLAFVLKACVAASADGEDISVRPSRGRPVASCGPAMAASTGKCRQPTAASASRTPERRGSTPAWGLSHLATCFREHAHVAASAAVRSGFVRGGSALPGAVEAPVRMGAGQARETPGSWTHAAGTGCAPECGIRPMPETRRRRSLESPRFRR